jgi:hypothetical protein
MMTSRSFQSFEGRQVCVALRDGSRIDDCQLISAGGVCTATLWLFSNGMDVFVPSRQVLDMWEAPIAGRAA